MDKFTKYVLACLMAPLGDPNNPMTLWGVPFNIIGGSGVGKTARIGQICRALTLPCFPIYTSTKQPEHFSGVPVGSANGFHIECILPQVTAAIDARRAVIYLDEISTASGAVQAALLSFINERQAGEYVLPPMVRFALSMNPPDVAANGQELTLPMVNRMGHFQYTNPTILQWRQYMDSLAPGGQLSLGLPSFKDAEEQVKKTWAIHYAHVQNITGGFLEANAGTYTSKVLDEAGKEVKKDANKLWDQPDPDDPRAGRPWPSHRTWKMAVCGVTAARCLELDPTLEIDIVASLVGEGLAIEWLSYMKKENLPKPSDALDGTWQVTKRMDVVRAVLSACANYVTSQQDVLVKHKRAKQCWELLKRCMDKGYSDISVPAARVLIVNGLDADCQDQSVADAAEEVCAELNSNGMLEYILRKNRR